MTPDPTAISRPRLMRPVWAPGIQYEGETTAQMQAREAKLRALDAAADAEEARLWRWKLTPWWTLN